MPIKLSKAIEILTREVHDITLSPDPDLPDALKLGIEALKDIQHCRTLGILSADHYLPGEEPEE